MDSTPAACAASPEWHWFWFWFGLLILINIATEIALCTIAATTRHLLVCMTSLGHHTILAIIYCGGMEMTTGYSNWNTLEMLQICCGGAVAATMLPPRLQHC